MNELDQLLQDLNSAVPLNPAAPSNPAASGVPKNISTRTSSAARISTAPVKTTVNPSASFTDLDNLLTDLNAAEKSPSSDMPPAPFVRTPSNSGVEARNTVTGGSGLTVNHPVHGTSPISPSTYEPQMAQIKRTSVIRPSTGMSRSNTGLPQQGNGPNSGISHSASSGSVAGMMRTGTASSNTPPTHSRSNTTVHGSANNLTKTMAAATPPQASNASNANGNDVMDLDSLMNELAGLVPTVSAKPNQTNQPSNPLSVSTSTNNPPQNSAPSSPTKSPMKLEQPLMFVTSPDAPAKVCGGCNEQISGPSIAAGGKYYHMEHLRCSVCKRGLAGATLFEKDGNLYCENDYHELYSPKCAYCSESILDRCISALGKHFHPEHFFCSQCGKEFGTNGFLEHEGKAYCEEDYFNLFAPVCGNPKCEKPIMADTINALGKTWHPGCFVCGECSSPFTNGTFFDYDNIPYCETHYHAKKGSICPACTKPIVGRCITALNKKWHPEHFACGFCQKVLGKIPFKEASDKPFCIPCFTRLYG